MKPNILWLFTGLCDGSLSRDSLGQLLCLTTQVFCSKTGIGWVQSPELAN